MVETPNPYKNPAAQSPTKKVSPVGAVVIGVAALVLVSSIANETSPGMLLLVGIFAAWLLLRKR